MRQGGPVRVPILVAVLAGAACDKVPLMAPTEILADATGKRPLAVLSGPSHAEEVARGLPNDEEVEVEVAVEVTSVPTFAPLLRAYMPTEPRDALLCQTFAYRVTELIVEQQRKAGIDLEKS